MIDKYFIDTNIIIYAYDFSIEDKQRCANKLLCEGLESEKGVISTQVLSEFFVNMTRKITQKQNATDAMDIIKELSLLEVVSIDKELILEGIGNSIKHKINYWDGLILASAQWADCKILYSEDFQDGQKYGPVTVKNPFKKN